MKQTYEHGKRKAFGPRSVNEFQRIEKGSAQMTPQDDGLQ